MSFLEALGENWKSVLAIVVLVVVNVLTFSAHEMELQRERDLSASLISSANESANREARLAATSAAQATRISQLESALSTADCCSTATPERLTRAVAPTATAAPVDAMPSPTVPPATTATLSPLPGSTPTASPVTRVDD